MEGFSSIVASLTFLTNKKAKFEWTEACDKCFQELEDRITSAPMLPFPKCGDSYTMYCDASRVGLGCVIMQSGKVIEYVSRKLKVL